MKTTDQIIKELARSFSQLLKQYLTEDQILEIIKRNDLPQYFGCCATHDFLDSNMVMDEAFTEVMGREINIQSDLDLNIWNQAWNEAKKEKFNF